MDDDVIKGILIIGFLVLVAVILGTQMHERNIMLENMTYNTNKIVSHQVVVHDTVKVKEIVYDTIKEYITSTVYSNAYPARMDTFEVHQGRTVINIEFADGSFGLDATEYQLLCNGSFYLTQDSDGDEWTNCNGEWLLKMRGTR